MDKYIISQIVLYLNQKDLICFALVNKLTYDYCKHTDIHNKKCDDKHITYHFNLSLYENAKLLYSMNILSGIKCLYENRIGFHKYNLKILLTQQCGTTTKIVFGRNIIINSIVYSYDNLIVLCDSRNDVKVHKHNKVYNIFFNIQRLQHKINSIISHKYVKINKKITNNLTRDCHKDLIKRFEIDVHKYFIKLIKLS